MARSEVPVRISKLRAHALLTIIEAGFAEEMSSISETFGVSFNRDGTVDWKGDELVTKEEERELRERLDTLNEARAAASIFIRRYT